MLGIKRRQFAAYLARGCPGEPRRYPLREIVEWCKANVWKARQVVVANTEDDALFAADSNGSPNLERWRKARADGAEMDLAFRRGELLKREDVHYCFASLANAYRSAGEQLVRLFGNEVAEIINDAIDVADAEVRRRFGDDSKQEAAE